MTDTVQIMPNHPIEVEPSAVKGRYAVVTYESEDGKERHTSILPDVGWVEVSDPITWDGSDHAAKAINDALPDGAAASPAETSVYGHLGIKSAGDHPRYASVEADWRIRIEGDSFVILPPRGDLTSGETVRVTRFVSSEESR
ncbi:MAG: hypothetical protein BWY85_00327 [Firmicutes bacterium ADurb.Bin506]|nr:MAG: hypothetical protein BWY85_00327 [Firmicutes bacterium ADurb.Bin506]